MGDQLSESQESVTDFDSGKDYPSQWQKSMAVQAEIRSARLQGQINA